MVELAATVSAVNVVPAEYKRLLGYPTGYSLEGRALDLADWARQWYREHGRPWIFARRLDTIQIDGDSLVLAGEAFHCQELLKNLHDAAATGIVVAAVSAGPELEAAAQQAWRDDKPDEYFFLEVYGSAVVEHLVTLVGGQICAWADSAQVAVLPHYSPGYGTWDVAEQPKLMQVIRAGGDLPGYLDVLESGMLRPKKSLLGVFGLTAAVERAQQLVALVPCERCSLVSCRFRRSAYRNADEVRDLEMASTGEIVDSIGVFNDVPLSQHVAQYKINRKALDRWANERLTLSPGENGTIDVIFKHEGSTCSNLGRPLLFDYHVRLSSALEGYRILKQECAPATNDVGHRSMCSYLRDPAGIMTAITDEKPLLGHSLGEVLSWQRPSTAASCYCDRANRLHMWGQVLETIHYALHRD